FLPWAEIAFTIPACVICIILFIILISLPLPNACKSFLLLNTFSLFSVALCQALIAEWTMRNKRGIGPDELHYFPLIFIHQIFYLISTASLFFLTCERLLLCFHPTLYMENEWNFFSSFIFAIFLETRNISDILTLIIDISTLPVGSFY
ncbi:hypothetical protein PFISCL1PPCAC_14717, partial [Pristionchus fissidentatus]